MTWLLYPYVLNILVLTPVGLGMLLGGPEAQRRVFSGRYPDSAGMRTLLGSLWTAALIVSVLGLFYPVSMSPLLLVQVIYKTLWWIVFALPRLVSGRSKEVHWGSAGTFLFMLLTYPWVMPWGAMFTH
jgi:hypothetical protein